MLGLTSTDLNCSMALRFVQFAYRRIYVIIVYTKRQSHFSKMVKITSTNDDKWNPFIIIEAQLCLFYHVKDRVKGV